jgi:hypothetical protein
MTHEKARCPDKRDTSPQAFASLTKLIRLEFGYNHAYCDGIGEQKMESTVALSLKCFLEIAVLYVGALLALSIGKYLIWRSGACLPGVIPCK